MIGMPGIAERVVGHDHMRAAFPHHPHHIRNERVGRLRPERVGQTVLRQARHVGVVVPEPAYLTDPQHLRGAAQLGRAHGGQLGGVEPASVLGTHRPITAIGAAQQRGVDAGLRAPK